MSDSMNRDRNRERHASPEQKREAAELSARRSDNEREPPPGNRRESRQQSFVEPREWRGAGVCGDRHTD